MIGIFESVIIVFLIVKASGTIIELVKLFEKLIFNIIVTKINLIFFNILIKVFIIILYDNQFF